jgi:hypothetical protein
MIVKRNELENVPAESILLQFYNNSYNKSSKNAEIHIEIEKVRIYNRNRLNFKGGIIMASITSLGSDNISTLLGSLSSSSQSSSSIYDSISTYRSIVNGSYGKLLTAYYNKTGSSEKTDTTTKNSTTTKIEDQSKVLSSVKEKSDKLATTAAELATTGSKSLFQGDDTSKAVEKVQDFVTDYNNTITAAKSSTDSRTNSRTSAMVENTKDYASKLSNVGITIKDDNTLSVDTDKLKKASMNDLKDVFNGSGSFASTTTQRAARVGAQAALSSSTSSSYTSSATYNTTNLQNVYNGLA